MSQKKYFLSFLNMGAPENVMKYTFILHKVHANFQLTITWLLHIVQTPNKRQNSLFSSIKTMGKKSENVRNKPSDWFLEFQVKHYFLLPLHKIDQSETGFHISWRVLFVYVLEALFVQLALGNQHTLHSRN